MQDNKKQLFIKKIDIFPKKLKENIKKRLDKENTTLVYKEDIFPQIHQDIKYNHIGVPLENEFEGEIHLAHLKMSVTNHEDNFFKIQWQRFWDKTTYPKLVQTVPHIAFEIKSFEEFEKEFEFIIKPNSPSEKLIVAFIQVDNMPIELMKYND